MSLELNISINKLGLKHPASEIAKKTGYDLANISKYITGKLVPTEAFLKSYCEAYNLNYIEEFKLFIIKKEQTIQELIQSTGLSKEKILEKLNEANDQPIISEKEFDIKIKSNSKDLFDILLMPLFGFYEKGDIGYLDAVNNLKLTVDTIKHLTGASIEDISIKIYNNPKTIYNALNGGWVSNKMANYLAKKYNLDIEKIKIFDYGYKPFNNLEINEEKLKLELIKTVEVFIPHYINYKDAFFAAETNDAAYDKIHITKYDADLYLTLSEIVIPSKFTHDDIIGLKKSSALKLRNDRYYVVVLNSKKIILGNYFPKNKEYLIFRVDDLENIINVKDIKEIYEVTNKISAV